MEFSIFDERIVNLLLENSRLSYRQLAQKLSVSVATVAAHTKKLEKNGVIKKYTALVDYEKLGYDVSVLIHLRISKGRLSEIGKKIAVHSNVVAVYDHTGHFDAAILAKFKTRKAMDVFLKKLQSYDFVERTETMLILNTFKEGVISI
ncbi:MAG: Lrp/AsnC family transcriptional regulator [Candidatus Aenigmarchaeota archaeon]|nr:Lrp/AsnC family transcriptional regulator [Candidatus Aenigmarchaeota archaeon]